MFQAAKEFCEDDIDKIMTERTHRIVVDAPGKTASWLSKKAGLNLKKKVGQTCAGERDSKNGQSTN